MQKAAKEAAEAALEKYRSQQPVVTHRDAGRRLQDLKVRLNRQRTLASACEDNMKKWETNMKRCAIELDKHEVCG